MIQLHVFTMCIFIVIPGYFHPTQNPKNYFMLIGSDWYYIIYTQYKIGTCIIPLQAGLFKWILIHFPFLELSSSFFFWIQK